MQVFSDFDGTISTQDSLRALLNEFGGDSWSRLEAKASRREISERDLLSECFRNFGLSPREALEWVKKEIQIDPYFMSFLDWARGSEVPVIILSGGFEEFIEAIFDREGIQGLPVFANRVDLTRSDWQIETRKGPRLCELYSHCKCSSLLRDRSRASVVYVGDGLTDACVAKRADVIFAKSWLQTHLQQEQQTHYAFDSFLDVKNQLSDQEAAQWGSGATSVKVAMSRNEV